MTNTTTDFDTVCVRDYGDEWVYNGAELAVEYGADHYDDAVLGTGEWHHYVKFTGVTDPEAVPWYHAKEVTVFVETADGDIVTFYGEPWVTSVSDGPERAMTVVIGSVTGASEPSLSPLDVDPIQT